MSVSLSENGRAYARRGSGGVTDDCDPGRVDEESWPTTGAGRSTPEEEHFFVFWPKTLPPRIWGAMMFGAER